jgi:hypothetical protein
VQIAGTGPDDGLAVDEALGFRPAGALSTWSARL